MFKGVCSMILGLAVVAAPIAVHAGGGPASALRGGVADNFSAIVKGKATAIDFANKRISIGASYYGSGVLTVNSATKIRLNGVQVPFTSLKVGDFCECRYDPATRIAGKIEATR
jgi:hypothetical protein